MAGVAAQIGFDEEPGYDLRIGLWKITSEKQPFGKLEQCIVVKFWHGRP
jgi:hypothetical protein